MPPIETALADLLGELSGIQSDLLAVLSDKRSRLLDSDTAKLPAVQAREEELMQRLQACHDRRQALLARAGDEGLPSGNLTSLADALSATQRQQIRPRINEAAARMRLLQHQSLTNWVLVQRTLIHLAQLLEIIATGGRLKPTYGNDDITCHGGALVDQAA
jgi:flagellar biosynthesis/type III secretory pathway chaperone